MNRCALSFCIVLLFAATNTAKEPAIDIALSGDIATVTIDGQLFTRYHAKSGNRPILWPIYGPTGVEMTRGYPMREPNSKLEQTDHPHHRSLWFSHGDVNGVDFWLEPDEERSRLGTIEHREFLKIESGEENAIITCSEWLDPDGEKICSDVRTHRFGADDERRWIDFDIVITNDTENPVKFGDTKEGTFAIRVAPWIKVDTKEDQEETNGRIVNNLGLVDKDAWGKAASWVDYHATRHGETLGVAILNHPNSFRFPTYWHVRTYGLFAANVFGKHNFKNSEDEDGSHELKPGESMSFSYRVLLHRGDEQEGRVPEAFIEYAKIDKASEGEELTHDDLTNESPAAEIELVDDIKPIDEEEVTQPVQEEARTGADSTERL